MFNNLKKELQIIIQKQEDLNIVNFSKQIKRQFVIVSEDMFVISTCIKSIIDKVKETSTDPNDITIVITNYRMIKKLDKESNNAFSKSLFGTSINT